MRRQLRCTSLLLVLSAAAIYPVSVSPVPKPRVQSNRDSSTDLSFDGANDLIVVNATLNGKGPFRFLIDTGASQHVMTSALAQSLGLKEENGGVVDAGGIGRIDAKLAQVAEVKIGGVTLEKQIFLVTPFPARFPFEGFLGVELFRQFVVRIDFRQQRLTLTQPRSFRYQGHGLVLPLKFHEGSLPLVRGGIDGQSGWFKLDTGYNASLALFGKFINEHKLLSKYKPEKSATGAGTLTEEINNVPVAAIREFRLGSLAMNDIPTSFFPAGGSNELFAGAIGTGLLKKFMVTIDYQKRRVILEANE